ncbi:6671_t:CDS:2 [Entrophospora sp. SA101]|nr:6671_t:CDS:2 [Entrophospora sp. SA101]CAJ0909797.1 11968_t:CDS:2 [Entrophospora sp. SA101]CAJ0924098.1 8425_t:CDS:2 [Entrophospora sp. SA101]
MSYQFESSSPPSLSSSISSLFTDQTQAKTKKEDYDYSILNIIPNLISEKRKKTIFVEKLVDMTCHIIEIIWADMFFDPSSKVISLKVFVKETLRRSRTSYSTLQATLLYLFRIKSKISLITDRRMFLAALIIASKYLQDCNYSNRAWSRVSGLPINELNTIEICFLRLIDYNLFISENNFKHWSKNQHSIVKLQEIMKSMDEFESLAQRSCQNDSSSGKYQNRKSTRITAN